MYRNSEIKNIIILSTIVIISFFSYIIWRKISITVMIATGLQTIIGFYSLVSEKKLKFPVLFGFFNGVCCMVFIMLIKAIFLSK